VHVEIVLPEETVLPGETAVDCRGLWGLKRLEQWTGWGWGYAPSTLGWEDLWGKVPRPAHLLTLVRPRFEAQQQQLRQRKRGAHPSPPPRAPLRRLHSLPPPPPPLRVSPLDAPPLL
jgi:hypothetical protein